MGDEDARGGADRRSQGMAVGEDGRAARVSVDSHQTRKDIGMSEADYQKLIDEARRMSERTNLVLPVMQLVCTSANKLDKLPEYLRYTASLTEKLATGLEASEARIRELEEGIEGRDEYIMSLEDEIQNREDT